MSLEVYKQYLKNTAAISGLFSESDSPYLVSRNVENMYCLAFDADNLGRADCSADARWGNMGIGLKTFLHGNGRTLQKVAEFNKLSNLYRDKTPKELVLKIAEMRNDRIEFTKRNYGINEMIYHCVTRLPGKILVFEEPMDLIDIKNIKSIKQNTNTITFEDGIHEYSFNLTKSTLYKRFILEEALLQLDVNILSNPYEALANMMRNTLEEDRILNIDIQEDSDYVPSEQLILPLFSERGGERNVPERSGLNQWNAKGRPRNPNEIYIPIPRWIHQEFPNFFPSRDISFSLRVPSGETLEAKVCQEGSKALMTNPNKALGEWLLRDVMNLKEHELLTYEMLEGLDIDSVIVSKISNDTFSIDFCQVGTYDYFKLNHDI